LEQNSEITQVGYSISGAVAVQLNCGQKYMLSYADWSSMKLGEGNTLSFVEISKLKNFSTIWSIKKKALKLLGMREHSDFELKIKLKQNFNNMKLIDKCIGELQQNGLQSNLRYTQSYVRSRVSNSVCGPYLIISELVSKGISKDLAESVIQKYYDQDLWKNKGRKIIEKKGGNLTGHKKYAKLWNCLFQKGYSSDMIYELFSEQKDFVENNT